MIHAMGAATRFELIQASLPRIAQPLVITVGIGYFAVIIAISIWASRRTRTAADFFVAGNGIGLVALTVASVTSSVSGFAFIGGPGFIYAAGLGALLTGVTGVALLQADDSKATFSCTADPSGQHLLLRELLERGVPVCSFGEQKQNLQDAYLRTVGSAEGKGVGR